METYKEAYDTKLKFVRAELYKFSQISLPKPFWDATGGPFCKVPVDCWLVLYEENGIWGQGPCSLRMKEQFLPLLLNQETNTYKEWFHRLYWSVRNYSFSGETAVEIGRLDYIFHDILAKQKQMPMHKFLGAKRDWVKVYASGCGTNLSVQEAVQEAEEYTALGYDTIKIKAGRNFGENLKAEAEKVAQIRKAIGDSCKLAVDINQLWEHAEQALEFIKWIEEYKIAWLEEPFQAYNMRELKRLSQMTDIPLAMGESPRCYYPMESYVDAGVKHLEPIPSNLSSVEDWIRARDLAFENNLCLSSGGYSHMTASFVASGRKEDMVEYLIPVMKPLRDIMKICPEEKQGKFFLPEVEGSCVIPDFEEMKKQGFIEGIEIFKS